MGHTRDSDEQADPRDGGDTPPRLLIVPAHLEGEPSAPSPDDAAEGLEPEGSGLTHLSEEPTAPEVRTRVATHRAPPLVGLESPGVATHGQPVQTRAGDSSGNDGSNTAGAGTTGTPTGTTGDREPAEPRRTRGGGHTGGPLVGL